MLSAANDGVFHALADVTRRQILLRLAESSPRTATQLAGEFPITRQGVSKHLDLLAAAGLVRVQPKGRERHYTLAPEPLRDVTAFLDAIGARWDARLQRLKSLIEAGEE